MRLSDDQSFAFAEAVRNAIGRDDLLLAIDCIYTQLQDAIDLRKPVCDASGRCCHFEEYGHRLFVTTAEMAAFLSAEALHVHAGLRIAQGCPFQVQGLCSVHTVRPFGCRIFFCDPTADQWQAEQYERLHGQIKRVHDTLAIPYFYVEWREALRAIQGVVASAVVGAVDGGSRSTLISLPARA